MRFSDEEGERVDKKSVIISCYQTDKHTATIILNDGAEERKRRRSE